ncbi:MFS transporter [Telmatospirillum sp.]|uniref:MFS transporter n=1 Tax=Telmatospirillum sp. TaxID=2079197 RepID=UPI00284A5155|nr:MFS transporter [Telmatospirillum sp.]MDR3437128.1 MFS transporter [Telmatospirillum sp.]
MSKQANVAAGEYDERITGTSPGHNLKSDFGVRGWSIIVIEGLLIWIAAGVQVHGLNVIVPTLSSTFGIDSKTLLFWATPASWGSVVSAFALAKVCEWKGIKFTILLSLVICALCFGLMGTWATVVSFVLLFAGVNFFGTGYGYVGGLMMITNWFPRKKNLALGWVTMGQTMSTALFVPALAWLFETFGVQNGFWGVSLAMILLAAVVVFFVRNTPEEFGCSPDNEQMSAEEIERSRREQEAYVCPLTTTQLLGMKDVWLIGVASGGVYVVLVGVLSQLVPRLMAMGYDLHTAIMYLSIAAFIGVPGSYCWGWIGQKMGSKAGIIFYSLWWLGAVVLNMFEFNPITLWTSLVMIGFSFGGATNLTTSIVAEKFHRGAFVKAFGVIAPIQGIVRCCSFAVLAFGLTYLGGYAGAYALLAVIAVIDVFLFWITDLTPVD